MLKKFFFMFNSVINFRRVTHFRLCLLETQVIETALALAGKDEILLAVVNRPGVAGAVLQTASSLSD